VPVGAIKYEDLWVRAKELVSKQYPNVKKGSARYWQLVMGIYRRMEQARDKRR
jgi:hypothetical protein